MLCFLNSNLSLRLRLLYLVSLGVLTSPSFTLNLFILSNFHQTYELNFKLPNHSYNILFTFPNLFKPLPNRS